MARASVTYPAATEPLIVANPKVVGHNAAENANVSAVKTAEQSGSNTYVFATSQTFMVPGPNGFNRMIPVHANAPIILSAADVAALTKVGVTVPSPS